MKLRYFLRGLGAGIVFTVMVLGLSNSNVEKVELTDNEIMARARALGMVTKEEQLDESLNQIMNEPLTGNEEDITEEVNPVEDTVEDAVEDTVANTTVDTAEENAVTEDEPESVLPEPLEEEETQIVSKVTISPGMTSKQVASAFLSVGLISNPEEFDDFLCNNGYSSRIRVGTFTIEGKPDYSELARIITTK